MREELSPERRAHRDALVLRLKELRRISACISAVASRPPEIQAGPADPVDFAQRQMEHGAALIHKLRGTSDGDAQAVEAYQAGVAVGFYGLEATSRALSSTPIPGSPWEQRQLKYLRRIGIGHGACYRDFFSASDGNDA